MQERSRRIDLGEHKYLEHQNNKDFSDKDERLVWQQFLEGDDQSLIYIYNKYADLLYNYGKQFSKKFELIKDCIQELFCDLIDNRSSLSSAQSVKAYLFASLKRRILKEAKKEDRYQLEEEGFNFSFSEVPITIPNLSNKLDLYTIHEKLNLLSVNQREAIYLHFYEGLSYTEIAEILKIKVSSARILTYRALDNLQKYFVSYLSSILILFGY